SPPAELSDTRVNFVLTLIGTTYNIKRNSVYILIDTKKSYRNLDEQIKAGVLNSSIQKQYSYSHPITYSDYLAETAALFIIPSIYQNHENLNYIHVYVNYKYYDLLGNYVTSSLLSFDMTRHLNNKINWTKFLSSSEPLVFPSFKFVALGGGNYQPKS
ncbi:MAG: hypothetical protein NTU49_03615, partial [Gammaproteobacteria bacterium]|nr:hypothetical protein [Gammaproteobacteria bacterium]